MYEPARCSKRCRPNDCHLRTVVWQVYVSTHHGENPSLARCVLAGPGEVASLKTERAVLGVSSTDTNGMDTLGTELGVGGLTAELELSLLAVVGALSTGR